MDMFILMSKMYKCSCGKWHKSRTTVARHKNAMESPERNTKKDSVPLDVPLDKGQVSHLDKKVDKNEQSTGSFLKEINLKGEFDRMTKVINPKKGKEDEENECGACHGKFSGSSKFCPHCGVEFE